MMKYLSFFMAILFSAQIACQSKSQQSNTAAPSGSTTQTAAARTASLKNVNVQEAGALTKSNAAIQILDVRTPEEWAGGIVAGATKINFHSPDFSANLSQLDKSKPVLVYCAAGGRSAQASAMMQKMGFAQVYNMTDGFGAWKNAGLPIK